MDCTQDQLTAAWRRAWAPIDRRQIYESLRRFKLAGEYAVTGPFKVERSRQLILPLQLLHDQRVRMVNLLKSPRSGGSLIGDLFFHWVRRQAPGPFMWTFQADDDAGDHYMTRIKPTIEANPDYCTPLVRQKRSLFQFRELTAYIQGANINSLQRKGIRYEINDEVWRWAAGMLAEAFARTEDYKTICKILNISQAGLAGDQWDLCCSAGKRFDWGMHCFSCNHLQPLEFFGKMLADPETPAGIIWDKTARLGGGGWDVGRAAATARFRCRACGHEHPDEPATWHRINREGEYIDRDPDRTMRNVTVRWNSLVNGFYGDLVTEFLQSCEARDAGVIDPLKKFYQKKLNLPWDESQIEEKRPLPIGGYYQGEPWQLGELTALTADYQEGRGNDSEHYWVVIRSWRRGGASRLLWTARCRQLEEIDALQARFAIKAPAVCIDGGDRLLDIAAACASRGWTVLVGDDPETFPHRPKAGGRPILRAWSPRKKIDPHRGTKLARRRHAWLFYWSNPSVKNILWRLRHGRGAKWELPADLPEEYKLGLDSELKFRSVAKRDGAVTYFWKNIAPNKFNHHWDCECMQVVVALIAGLLRFELDDNAKPDSSAKTAPGPKGEAPAAPHNETDQLGLALKA